MGLLGPSQSFYCRHVSHSVTVSFLMITTHYMQGVVTAICPIHPSATAIKVKSRDQAYKIGAIEGSRWLLGPKLAKLILSIWKYHN